MNEKPTLIEIRPHRYLHIFHHNVVSEKTLFLLHGVGGRVAQWREQIAFFKPDYNIIAPDNLGHGKSAKPKSPPHQSLYGFQEISQDHQAIFDRYHTRQNIVIGHSYGGAFASFLALKNPEKISKVILIAPVSFSPRLPTLVFRLPAFLLTAFRLLLDKQFARLAYHAQTDRRLVKQEMAQARLNSMSIMKELILNMQYLPQVDISQLQQPALVLFSREDKIVPARQSINFYQQLSRVEFNEITHAKHVLMLEQPRQVNHFIQEFLAK